MEQLWFVVYIKFIDFNVNIKISSSCVFLVDSRATRRNGNARSQLAARAVERSTAVALRSATDVARRRAAGVELCAAVKLLELSRAVDVRLVRRDAAGALRARTRNVIELFVCLSIFFVSGNIVHKIVSSRTRLVH